jgi:aminoglycoside phosphotransferase (APT) family kinase protein
MLMQSGSTPQGAGTPIAEVDIDEALVAGLLAGQHPDLAQLPLRVVDAGWDNAMYRLGDQLAVRLPRRAAAATLIIHEQAWLPYLAPRLTLPIPAPYRTGSPAPGYPWHWSVVPWLAGMPADQHEPSGEQARIWAAFLRSLHRPAPANPPPNPVRGGLLQERAPWAEERLQRLSSKTDLITPRLREIWHMALQAPLDVQPTWLHGDLHPRNILIEHNTITGVIDWGDITAGDCATDLASIWMLFADPEARQAALDAYALPSEATLHRARGWAVHLGAVLLDTGLVDNLRNAAIGERTLRRLAEDER